MSGIQKLAVLLGILFITLYLTYRLADASRDARLNEARATDEGKPSTATGLIVADYKQGIQFGKEILGFAVALAGFFGIAARAKGVMTAARIETADVQASALGIGGLLAGATMMGDSAWAAPAAFAGLAIGGGLVALRTIPR